MTRTISLAFSLAMPWVSLIFLPDAVAGGGLDLLVGEGFERDSALDELLLQDLGHRGELVFVRRGELEGVFALELDRGVGVLEVESGVDFLRRLVDRVLDFLDVHFGHDIMPANEIMKPMSSARRA
jgi:hypothetical protein